jgi:hypothetical protein
MADATAGRTDGDAFLNLDAKVQYTICILHRIPVSNAHTVLGAGHDTNAQLRQ